MRKIYLTLLAGFLTMAVGFSQDHADYTQYHLNPVLINPAAAGLHGGHHFMLNYRNNWSSFQGAPRAYTFSYDGSVMDDRVGLGLIISGREFGVERQLRTRLSYSYRFGGDDWKWSVGLSTELERFSLSNDVFLSDLYEPGDPIIEDAANGINYFDLSAGIYGEFQDRFFFGLAAPDMVRARIDDVSFEDDSSVSLFEYFNLLLGYRFEVPNYGMTLEPSVFVKRLRNIPFQIDFNVLAHFLDEQLAAGLSYSTGEGDRLGFLIGTRFDNVRLYYSYDLSFQTFQDYSNGSHEFSLSIRLNGNEDK
ncbi:MAG: type IX secretion system membrane protein PorP/SprF [Saprospirales bacterium]|nr:MAG: type IX secretion system membrane protein PorP/SprF [Saprospirales bacterium]